MSFPHSFKALVYIYTSVFSFLLLLNIFSVGFRTSFYKTSDFVSYLMGARIVKDGAGKYLYNQAVQSFYQNRIVSYADRPFFLPYKTLPFTALLYIPFTFLSIIDSYRLSILFNLSLLAVFVFLVKRYSKSLFLALLATFSFYFIVPSILQGQPSVLLLMVFWILFVLLKGNKSLLAGILCALFMIKFQYLVCAPFIFIIVKNKFRFSLGFLFSVTCLMLLNFLISGPHFLSNYIFFLSKTENRMYGSWPLDMYSIQYGFMRLLGSVKGSILLSLVAYLGAVILVIKQVKKKVALELIFAPIMIFTLLFGYHVLGQDLILLLVPNILILTKTIGKKNLNANLLTALTAFFYVIFPLTDGIINNWMSYLLLAFAFYVQAYSFSNLVEEERG